MRLLVFLLMSFSFAPSARATASISHLDPICKGLVLLHRTHEYALITAKQATEFLLHNDGGALTVTRRDRINQSLWNGGNSISYLLDAAEAEYGLALVPDDVADAEHREHRKARGSTQNAAFALELTLTVLISTALKLHGFGNATAAGAMVVGGLISRITSGWLADRIYGPSFRQYRDKVVTAAGNGSTKPLSYGHVHVMEHSDYNLEILYATDSTTSEPSAPKLLIHLMPSRGLKQ